MMHSSSQLPGHLFRVAVVFILGCSLLLALYRFDLSPSARAWQPATPIASPVATGLRIHDLQGAAYRSPHEGQFVQGIPGIVTAIVASGFYLQDPVPDADDATSEGLLVTSALASRGMPQVTVGDAILVDGFTEENSIGDGDAKPLTTTQFAPVALTILAHDQPLPAPVVIGAVGRQPPSEHVHEAEGNVESTGTFRPEEDAIDFYESLEGMLVAIPDAVVVGPRTGFGEVVVLANGGVGAEPLTPRGGIAIEPEHNDFNPERLVLDDEVLRSLGATTPNVDVGARFPDPLVGVLDYAFAAYRVQLTAPHPLTSPGAPREVAQVPADHELVIATLNVENLAAVDPTLWDVEEAAKVDGLAEIIVDHLHAPDLIVLEELQDNNGQGSDPTKVVDADATAKRLTDAIVAHNGPAYSFIDIDPEFAQDGGAVGGNGNIRVGFLYRTDGDLQFTPRGTPTATTAVRVEGDPGTPKLSTNPGRILAPGSGPLADAFNTSRKPLVAEFSVGDETLFVVGNHFASRTGSEAFFGREQPPDVADAKQREEQAELVAAFVGDILERDEEALVVVLGDINDFPNSPALTTLAAADGQGPLTNLVGELPVEERYTYVFEGNSQALDHLLVSRALRAALVPDGFDIVHVNAEYHDQVSDHDPLVARFHLTEP